MKFDKTVETMFVEGEARYVIIMDGGQSPKRIHKSRYAAEREAERLAKALPGEVFHVAKIKRTVRFLTEQQREFRDLGDKAKQMAARSGMEPGVWVRVSENHHRYPAEIGYIDHLGEGDDLAVYIRLHVEGGSPIRFAPSSLTVLSRPAVGRGDETTAAQKTPLSDLMDRIRGDFPFSGNLSPSKPEQDASFSGFSALRAKLAEEREFTPAYRDESGPDEIPSIGEVLASLLFGSIAASYAAEPSLHKRMSRDAVLTLPRGTLVYVVIESTDLDGGNPVHYGLPAFIDRPSPANPDCVIIRESDQPGANAREVHYGRIVLPTE